MLYEKIIPKVHHYITDNHMIDKGSHVVAGISGGADSMCLLFVLLKLSELMDIRVTAVHVNHGIRGEAADKDQNYVEEICRAQGVECISYRADIPAMAKQLHLSEEAAGRQYRYECFEAVRARLGADKIAVAHHKDDLAETVLFNLFRGSQLKGLIGIPPVRDRIIRPLLCLKREEIEALAEAWHIQYRTDHTNYETEYTRNKIRLELLPYISREINAGAVEHISSVSVMALEVYGYINKQAMAAYEKCVQKDGGILLEPFLKEEAVIQKAVLRLAIEAAAGKLKDITSTHIEDVRALKDKAAGKRISLPYGMTAVRTPKAIALIKADKKPEADTAGSGEDGEIPEITVPGSIKLVGSGIDVSFSVENFVENQRIPQNIYTKWFDYDKISFGLKIRHRRTGDYMVINERGAKKTIQRLMIDEKLPKACRDRQWLLSDGSHILWLIGGRISEYYKVTQDTKRILIVEVKGEEEHGRQNQCIIN